MAQDKEVLDQEELERILQQASTPPGPTPQAAAAAIPADGALDQASIDMLLGAGQPGKAADESQPAKDPPPSQFVQAQQNPGPGRSENAAGQAGKAVVGPQVPADRDQSSPSLVAADGGLAHEDIEVLLQRAEEALASVDAPSETLPPGVTAFRFPELTGAAASSETATLDLIREVELDLRIELGRTHMYLEDVLKLRKGSVVPLDKLAGDPVDIYVNGRLVARGEVLVLNDNFCVRVAELIAGHRPAP